MQSKSLPSGYDPKLLTPWHEIIGHRIKTPQNLDEVLFGLEMEYEGTQLINPNHSAKYWTTHDEGSLRNGIEYVLSRPSRLHLLDNILDDLMGLVRLASFQNSIRTSTHIHFNACNYTIIELYNILTAYYLMENILVGLHGKDREGNLHCLRLKDSLGIVSHLTEEISEGSYLRTWSNNQRYAACNIASLTKFGSLEFRFLKALTNKEEISLWVRNMAFLVNTSAREFSTPQEILSFYYSSTLTKFLSRFFDLSFIELIRRTYSTEEIRILMSENTTYIYEIISGLSHSHSQKYKPFISSENEDIKEEKKDQVIIDELEVDLQSMEQPSIWLEEEEDDSTL